MLPNHATQTDPYLHECKGASTATVGQLLTAVGDGTATFQTPASAASGSVVKTQISVSTSTSTGTTTIPFDNTIPQKTEGTQFINTSYTPTTSGNKLRIKVIITGSYSVAAVVTVALFQDSNSDASAAVATQTTTTDQITQQVLTFDYTTVSASAVAWAVRVGGSTAGTFTLNGNNGTAIFGGVCVSSLLIEEIKA